MFLLELESEQTFIIPGNTFQIKDEKWFNNKMSACVGCAEPFVLAASTAPMHAVQYNHVDSQLLATANSRDGIALWDIRVPIKCVTYTSVCFVFFLLTNAS